MSTKAGMIKASVRPAGFTLWAAAVSALAGAALIVSAVALTVAARDRAVTDVGSGVADTAVTEAQLWDAGKLEAMALRGRVLAESFRTEGYAPVWDAGKIEAMAVRGRVLAESLRTEGYPPPWDAGKLEAIALRGRVLAG
jgi:hypothetical protein